MSIDLKHLNQEMIANNKKLDAYNEFKASRQYNVAIFEGMDYK